MHLDDDQNNTLYGKEDDCWQTFYLYDTENVDILDNP